MSETYAALTPDLFRTLAETDTAGRYYITPAMAAWLLEDRNDKNRRPLTKARSTLYLKYIQNGAWNPRISAFHVGRDGNIQNGQHRLKAISQHTEAVLGTFEFGMDSEAEDYYDLARSSRSAADNLARYGLTTKGAASILTQFVGYQKGGTPRPVDPGTYAKVLNEDYPLFPVYLMQADDIVKASPGLSGATTRYVAAAAILLSVGHSEARVQEFIEGLVEAPTQHPALFWTRRSVEGVGYGATGNNQAVHFLLHGFNKWVRNDSPQRRWDTDVKVPLTKLVKPRQGADAL